MAQLPKNAQPCAILSLILLIPPPICSESAPLFLAISKNLEHSISLLVLYTSLSIAALKIETLLLFQKLFNNWPSFLYYW